MKNLIYASSVMLVVLFFGFAVQKNNAYSLNSNVRDPIAQSKTGNEENTAADDNSIIALNESNFEEEVLNSSTPVVVEFYATWCGVCKKLSPNVEAFASGHGKMMKFGKVDVDANSDLTSKYGVEAIPRIIVFQNGKIVKDEEGYQSLENLEKNFCGMCKNN